MPVVTIEVKFKYSEVEIDTIISSVHKAMMDVLRIPARDRNIRFIEHDPRRFVSPPEASEKYTIVTIDMFSGRSLDVKRALYKAIVDKLFESRIPKSDVMIILREAPPDCWGIRGGQPACDIDLGFNINI